MTPVEVFLAVRALTRLGQAGQQAFEQAVRDQPIALPVPHFDEPSPQDYAGTVLMSADHIDRLRAGNDLAHLAHQPAGPLPVLKDDPASRAEQIRLVDQIKAAQIGAGGPEVNALNLGMAAEASGLIVVKQWAMKGAPPPPLARVGVALAEVALDYAAAKPSLFGVGANGEKLIAAVTLQLRELLPNPDDPAHWTTGFAEQATAIVFRASLSALSENVDTLIEEEALRKLVKGVTAPMVTLASQNPGHLPKWNAVRDTMLGPVAAAAAQAVIENQAKWLGAAFDPERALGKLTEIMLTEAAESNGLSSLVSEAGAASVYRKVFAVIGSNPALIAGSGGGIEGELVRDLLSRAAGLLDHGPTAFKSINGALLLGEAVSAFGTYLPKRIEGEDPWSTLAIDALGAVLAGASDAASGGRPMLEPDRVEALARLIFAQAAATPEMITGSGNAELRRIAGALFETLSGDDARLLGDEMWQGVAATAMREIARNPGALVGVSDGGPVHALGFEYLSLLLDTAAGLLDEAGRVPGNVLFGETLARAAELTLRTAAANAARLAEAEVRDAYRNLLRRLVEFAREQAGAVGAEDWLALFEQLVGPALRSGQLPDLSTDRLLGLLHKEIA